MVNSFLHLSADKKRKSFEFAELASGCVSHLLEKDIWIVWLLREIFVAPFAKNLVFKGGTSLSKGYGAIQRFSEDVDLAYDIRALIPDMVGDREDGLPSSRRQGDKWKHEVQTRLREWIAKSVVPTLEEALRRDGLSNIVNLRFCNTRVFVDYEPLMESHGYTKPVVILEFGGRSTGEPTEQREIVCDIAAHLKEFDFPKITPRIMKIERTFWEKATAIHVYCLKKSDRGERFARHWYDLAHLDTAGYVDAALQDRDLAMTVARHKGCFFIEKDVKGERIDYEAVVCGELVLVPEGEAFDALMKDYSNMTDAGLLHNDPTPFENIMARCREIEKRANSHHA